MVTKIYHWDLIRNNKIYHCSKLYELKLGDRPAQYKLGVYMFDQGFTKPAICEILGLRMSTLKRKIRDHRITPMYDDDDIEILNQLALDMMDVVFDL